MRHALATVLGLAATIACASSSTPDEPPPVPPPAEASAAASVRDDTFVVAVIGDGPYTEDGCDEHACLARQMERLDPRVDLLIHVGDIRPGDTEVPCTREQFAAVAALLGRADVPTVIVPGDNEWNDCPDPDGAARRWREVFLDPDGEVTVPWPVVAQDVRPENRSFDAAGVRFVAVNLVGGRVVDRKAWDRRLAEDVDWLRARLADAEPGIRAAVVIGHATPRVLGVPRLKLAAFFGGLRDVAREFDRPLLYVHGDGHDFVHTRDIDAPLAVRLEVERIGRAWPTLVTILPAGEDPFLVEEGDRYRCCD